MKPSEKMDQLVAKKDKKKYLPTPEEMKAVKELQKEEEEEEKKEAIRKIRRAADLMGIQLKKRAKGPNPLSVMGKKTKKE